MVSNRPGKTPVSLAPPYLGKVGHANSFARLCWQVLNDDLERLQHAHGAWCAHVQVLAAAGAKSQGCERR